MSSSIVANKTKIESQTRITSHIASFQKGLSNIHNNEVNISIWERNLSNALQNAAAEILNNNPDFKLTIVPKVDEIRDILVAELGSEKNSLNLIDDISELASMFCNLFKIDRAWIRLDSIDTPMCPRFHADKVKCRLVTTYVGPATEWLPHHLVDRSKLGHGNNGLPDHESGLFSDVNSIEQLETGHVALLKGEGWDGNQGAGLVHRSPHAKYRYKRLYMTIDYDDLFFSIYKKNKRFLS